LRELPRGFVSNRASILNLVALEVHSKHFFNRLVGIDGQRAAEYAENLEDDLRDLLDRAKSGDKYRAPAVRRVHIPKGSGTETRPIRPPDV